MAQQVKVTLDSDGSSHFGIPISEGPGVYRLLLTWPYKLDGRVKEIPLEDIRSVEEVEAGPRGEEPEPVG